MKPLKPSMKEKKRYLLVRGKELDKNIPKAIREFIGTLGMARTALHFIECQKERAIICINRKMLDHIKGAIALWPDKMFVDKVSGTLKGLRGKK